MKILNSGDILETIEMLNRRKTLIVRTVTMGISLLDCIASRWRKKACEKIYNKITRLAGTWFPLSTRSARTMAFPLSTSASA